MTTGRPTLADVIDLLEHAYPPRLAESWDRVGLVAGDPAAEVGRVVVAVDATDAVVDHALAEGADLLLVHHPPLMRGVHSVAADTPKGRLLHKLIAGGCALYSAHTNADSARPGVNDALADVLGLVPGRPLAPTGDGTVDRWVVTVPDDDLDDLLNAVFAAGAGRMSGYTECSFSVQGTGRFRPGDGTDPTIGTVGEPERVSETRVEFVAPPELRSAVRRAVLAGHPYEVPAMDVFVNHAGPGPGPEDTGLGRICELDAPMTLAQFTELVAERLPTTEWGVRAAGDPDAEIRRVALCGGSGDSLLGAARAAGADVYLTGDLRHHVVDEHLRSGGPLLVDAAHWALEFPWCAQAAALLEEGADLTATVCDQRTDPWTVAAGGGRVQR
ncbi:Nif3-like dinuclear metal center hexameric protein [Dietzia maris]|uniref:Nif3-like dinuclear metal center hexameric protein n=1 Tax=Dietzia maris TaxID=37915 RepID=UPI0021AF2280|nr:Nif3-like dinuclear metal center hexameric protein [Dietzia maris]MCT1435209.1 Nif3-like dinuclear metal center hexameric protein [Dietzia maris]MCT1521435.1 Nif3-like dinuclear metal center hexameric protein [Dietzia maris]